MGLLKEIASMCGLGDESADCGPAAGAVTSGPTSGPSGAFEGSRAEE